MFRTNITNLQEQLSLKPSHLETSIEYPQVFTLPYSRNFAAAYSMASTAKADANTSAGLKNEKSERKVPDKKYRHSRLIKIDTRIQRWYKQYEDIQSYINYLEFEYTQAIADLKAIKASLAKLSIEERRKKTENYNNLQQEYHNAIKMSVELKKQISGLNDTKKLLLREIQMNGYLAKELILEEASADPIMGDKKLEIYRKKTEIQQYLIGDIQSYFYGYDTTGEEAWKTMEKEVRDAFLELKPSTDLTSRYDEELKEINQKKDGEIKVDAFIDELLENQKKFKSNFKQEILCTSWTMWYQFKVKTDWDDNKIINYIFENNEYIKSLKTQGITLDNAKLIKLFSLAGEVYPCKNSILEMPKNYIHILRLNFLKKWNEPRIYMSALEEFEDEPVLPDHDPILEALEIINLQQKKTEVKSVKDISEKKVNHSYTISQFYLTPNGFYNQDGQSLNSFMQLAPEELSNKIIMLPFFDKNGIYSNEVFQIIIGPKKPGQYVEPMPPVVKFIENQVVNVSWQGIALGEIRHSVNLLPGESKKIRIERKNKLSRATSKEDKTGSDNKQHLTSSFDENLQNELSAATNVSQADQSISKSSQSSSQLDKSHSESSNESSHQDSASSNFSYEVGIKASASFLFGSMELSSKVGGGTNSSSQNLSHNRSLQNSSRENALTTSLSSEGQQMSKQSRDVATKNIQNVVRRVATDTSLNNKVEITSSTNEQSEESSASAEESVITNENVGRTANYNFFQVQNLYKTGFFLKDGKIVIKTGFELVEGTGIDDICVFELEEFNRIYSKLDQTYLSAVLSAVVAYKVIKQYTDLFDAEPKNNKFLKLSDVQWKNCDKENLKKLKTLFESLKLSNLINTSKLELDKRLQELKKLSFSFNEKVLISESFHTVNTPALYSDAQLGIVPTTEPYLEERRKVELEAQKNNVLRQQSEIDFQQAETGYLKAITNEKVFPTNFTFFQQPGVFNFARGELVQTVPNTENSL